MNLEEYGHRAGARLRAAVRPDHAAAYDDFQRLVTKRQRVHAAALAALAAMLVVAVLGGARIATGTRDRADAPVDPAPAPSEPSTTAATGPGCAGRVVSCLGGRTFRVAMLVDLIWRLPQGIDGSPDGRQASATLAEARRRDGSAGVTVLHQVSAAAATARPTPRDDVRTAEEFATWLAAQPYVDASPVRRTSVGGDVGWSVDVTVDPEAPPGPARCAGDPCYPVTFQWTPQPRTIGIRPGTTNRLLALDLHGSGLSVVWAWSRGDGLPAPISALVDSIRFE